MRDQHSKTPGNATPGNAPKGNAPQGIRAEGICGDASASIATSGSHLAKPSWRWHLLLGMAIVCAVAGVTVAAVPELFLSAVQVTPPHLHP